MTLFQQSHGSFFPERVHVCAQGEDQGRGGDAESDPRSGGSGRSAEESALRGGKLKEMKLRKAAEVVERGVEETLSYTLFPREHWRRIRTNYPLERILREVHRRTRVVGNFPDGNSALMLVAARLRHVESTKWGSIRYLKMERLEKRDLEGVAAG